MNNGMIAEMLLMLALMVGAAISVIAGFVWLIRAARLPAEPRVAPPSIALALVAKERRAARL